MGDIPSESNEFFEKVYHSMESIMRYKNICCDEFRNTQELIDMKIIPLDKISLIEYKNVGERDWELFKIQNEILVIFEK